MRMRDVSKNNESLNRQQYFSFLVQPNLPLSVTCSALWLRKQWKVWPQRLFCFAAIRLKRLAWQIWVMPIIKWLFGFSAGLRRPASVISVILEGTVVLLRCRNGECATAMRCWSVRTWKEIVASTQLQRCSIECMFLCLQQNAFCIVFKTGGRGRSPTAAGVRVPDSLQVNNQQTGLYF